MHPVLCVAVSRREYFSDFPEIQLIAMESRARRPGRQRIKLLMLYFSPPAHPKTFARRVALIIGRSGEGEGIGQEGESYSMVVFCEIGHAKEMSCTSGHAREPL